MRYGLGFLTQCVGSLNDCEESILDANVWRGPTAGLVCLASSRGHPLSLKWLLTRDFQQDLYLAKMRTEVVRPAFRAHLRWRPQFQSAGVSQHRCNDCASREVIAWLCPCSTVDEQQKSLKLTLVQVRHLGVLPRDRKAIECARHHSAQRLTRSVLDGGIHVANLQQMFICR